MYSSQFGGALIATKSIVNAYSVVGFSPGDNLSSVAYYGTKSVDSGALTANVLSTIFSKTGSGTIMPQLSIYTNDATARTLRVEVTVDGIVVFDFTSSTISNTNYGVCLAGTNAYTISVQQAPIIATNSLVVKVASNLTETAKFRIAYSYQGV
jgi:hypothetical protein